MLRRFRISWARFANSQNCQRWRAASPLTSPTRNLMKTAHDCARHRSKRESVLLRWPSACASASHENEKGRFTMVFLPRRKTGRAGRTDLKLGPRGLHRGRNSGTSLPHRRLKLGAASADWRTITVRPRDGHRRPLARWNFSRADPEGRRQTAGAVAVDAQHRRLVTTS